MIRPERRYKIGDVMTASPHCIGRGQTLSLALERMRVFRVRHLPVLEGGRISGVLSQRDVLFVQALPGVDISQVTVEEAMSTDVYAVPPQTSLADVARQMGDHKYGCVVVVDGGRVAGIFTAIDALRILEELLNARPLDVAQQASAPSRAR